MVREITCNAWALGFSGTHHVKRVLEGGPLTWWDLKMEWTKGSHLPCKYFKESEGVAHSSLLWRFLPGHVRLLKSSSHSPFIFLCLLDQFHFLFSHSSSSPQSQSLHLTWALCFSSIPGSPGMSEDQGRVFYWMYLNHASRVPLSHRVMGRSGCLDIWIRFPTQRLNHLIRVPISLIHDSLILTI